MSLDRFVEVASIMLIRQVQKTARSEIKENISISKYNRHCIEPKLSEDKKNDKNDFINIDS